jgi:hypothetical protein
MRIILSGLFAAILMATVWGAIVVPAEARFNIFFGVPESHQMTMSKSYTLTVFMLIGLWTYSLSLIASTQKESTAWIGAALMAFFLGVEVLSIRRRAPRRNL